MFHHGNRLNETVQMRDHGVFSVEGGRSCFFNYPGALKYFYCADGSYSSRETIHSHIIVWIELVLPACLTMCLRIIYDYVKVVIITNLEQKQKSA